MARDPYDANGNLTQEGSASFQYKYDGEDRLVSFNSGTATYTYVGALRVKKVAGSTTTVYIFSGSKVIAEYVNGAVSKEYVYSGSSLLATVAAGGATTYQHPDHLSTRVETDANGAVTRTFGQYPFGETWYETGTASKWKFTSYERDGESGLDYAAYRYNSSRLGRFMSPDPLAGSISSPQSLNRYTYVGNDPINFTDPLGLVLGPPKVSGGGDGGGGGGGLDSFWACGWFGLCGGSQHPPLLPPKDPDKGGGGKGDKKGGGGDSDKKKKDPGDPAALEECLKKATRDYVRDYNQNRKITGLGEALGITAEHGAVEVAAHILITATPVRLAITAISLVYAAREVPGELKRDWEIEWEFSARKELCNAAFGPR